MYALLRLHSELGGKLNENRKDAERIAADMATVEKVIKLFDPEYNVRSISAKRRFRTKHHFKRGTIFYRALDVLRVAEQPVTAREIAVRMLAKIGIKAPAKKLMIDTVAAIHAALLKQKGKSVTAHADRIPLRWSIIP